uniref:Integrase catalytic domain-containing protein n=1 Tax=Tanacetum cinerariifolium TaxID=118510 RepID=A0A6L2N5F7_TANCI|nr:hypothetical protein [Tanacetum cinerariifolium]
MAAILEKTEHNTDFHQIVDFLKASHIRRNLKLNDEDGISSFPDAELFENHSLMGYNILPNQSNIATAIVCLATNRVYNFLKMIFDGMGEGSANPTDPVSLEKSNKNVNGLRKLTSCQSCICNRLDRVIGLGYEPASLSRDDRQGEAFPTVSSLDAGQNRENIAKTSAMPYESSPRVTSLDAGADKSTELGSNDTKEMVNVLSSMGATNILSSGGAATSGVSPADVFPTTVVPTLSGSFQTVSAIFTTASVIIIEGLDRSNEVIAKHLQEYKQAEADLSVGEKIELISELVKYQDRRVKILKYQAQQSKPLSNKEQREFYMFVLRSHAGWGWKTKHIKGMTLEQLKEKLILIDQGSSKRIKISKVISEGVSEEELKGIMQLVPLEKVYIEALQEVIEFGDSYKVPTTDPNDTTTTSGDDAKSGRTVTITTEDMQRKKNDGTQSQERGRKENYRQRTKAEEKTPKSLMAIDGVGWDWSYMANEGDDHALVADTEAPKEFALMANTERKVFKNSLCSKDCKKNSDRLNSKIKDLTNELFEANNYIYHYKLAVAQLEGRLVEYKEREVKYIEKIRTLELYRESNLKSIETLSKKLETLKLEEDGVDGKLVGLLKALKNLDNLIESQRSSPNVESTSEEEKRVKRGTTRSQNHAYMRPTHRAAGHRPHGAPMRPTHRPAGHRRHGPPMKPMRPNMNGARPNISFFIQAHSYESRPFLKTSAGSSQNYIDHKGYWDSGCSRHMTGYISYLSDFEPFNGGYVSFGQGGCKITGKGTIKAGKLEFENVYFVKDLKYNMFSVSQICDNKNSVLFTDSECIVLGRDFKLLDDANILLRTPRQHNMYSIDLNNIVPHRDLTCLVAKASVDECILWHSRLGHLNVKTMNKLTFFLRTKDETSDILKKFITEIENLKDIKVKIFRCDNGGEFRNKEMNDFCSQKRIKREFSNARNPQQNGVAEKRNRTLIEAARTMLADAKLPVTFWAEAVNTTCCHVMILNTLENLGKFEAKGDEGYFIGYSMSSKAFRVFNKRTKRVEENLHVEFLENKATEKGTGPNWLFDIDSLAKSMNYVPVDASTNSTNLLDVSSTKVPEGSGNLNPTASISNPPADQMETLIVETPIPTVSSQVPTACSNDSPELSSDARLISKRVSNQEETPSLDNILSLTNRFKDILRVESSSNEAIVVEANVSNMETSITASPTPTLRIHKDHPKSQIIGPVDTPIQTRHKSKVVEKQSFIATIHQKTDPALLQFCLFSCFLSQVEPKNVFDALQDPSWVEAMHEELLQFKILNIDVKNAFLYGTIDEEVRKREDFILVQVCVDDIIFGSSNPQLCREFEALMHEKFQMSAMVAYSDSDYGGATQDHNSTTRGSQFLGRRLISWQCKKQTIVATSTTKAEYVAVASCCGQCKLFPLLGKLSTASVFVGFGLTFAGTSKYWGVLRMLMISLRLIPLGKGSGTPTEPHHTPFLEADPSYHTTSSMPLPSIPTAPIPPVTKTETTLIRQYTRRARIAQSSALLTVADEPASLMRDVSKGEACPTDSGFIANQDRATIAKSSSLPYDLVPRVTSPVAAEQVKGQVKVLEDREGVATRQSGDDAPIKGRSIDEGEAAAERISDDSEELARVLTSMDAATVLAGGIDVPTGSGSIPTAGPPAADIHTGSDAVPTASPIVAIATIVTPYSRRKGKEVMVDMSDSLARTNETIAKYVQEYQDFASELSLERRIELISDLVKYQDNYTKIYKFQSQQRRPWTKKQKKDCYMTVIKNNLGWKVKDFKGMIFEEIEAKFNMVWKQVKDFIPMGLKEEAERYKRKGIRFDHESSKKLKSSKEVIKDAKSTEEIPKEKMKDMM